MAGSELATSFYTRLGMFLSMGLVPRLFPGTEMLNGIPPCHWVKRRIMILRKSGVSGPSWTEKWPEFTRSLRRRFRTIWVGFFPKNNLKLSRLKKKQRPSRGQKRLKEVLKKT